MRSIKSAFLSTAPIVATGHGGGKVSLIECQALSETTDLRFIISPSIKYDIGNAVKIEIQAQENPFMWDYIVAQKIAQLKDEVDIVFYNGAPYTLTSDVLNKNTKVIVDVPAHNLEESIKEFETLLGDYPFKHMTNPALWAMYTEFIKNADLVICPSQASAAYVKMNPTTKARVEYVHHGADKPSAIKDYPEVFTVGYMGAMGPDKGFIYLAKAWALLMYKDAELITNNSVPEYCQGLLSRTKYRCTGFVEHVSDFYNQCSCYVCSSVTEAFGITALEAYAHYRPVVLSKGASGAFEVLNNQGYCYPVDIRDVEGIAESIDNIYKMFDTYKRVDFATVEDISSRYSWDIAKEKYKKLITEVIGENNRVFES